MTNSLESRGPKTFGLDGTKVTLKEKIGSLKRYNLSLFHSDFDKIEKKYEFRLEQFFGGINLIIHGKIKPISTPIFLNNKNHEELGIIYWEKDKPFLYSVQLYKNKRGEQNGNSW